MVASDYAAEFANELTRKPFDIEQLEAFSSSVKGLMADLGCGPGHIGRFLADRGHDVVGVDLSQQMVRLAIGAHPDMRFVVGDLRHIPLANQALGGAVCFYSLIHLAPNDAKNALKDMWRVLEPKGRLLLAVHAGEGTVTTQDWYGKGVDMSAQLFDETLLERFFEIAGFGVESKTRRPPYDFEYPTDRLYYVLGRRQYRH